MSNTDTLPRVTDQVFEVPDRPEYEPRHRAPEAPPALPQIGGSQVYRSAHTTSLRTMLARLLRGA